MSLLSSIKHSIPDTMKRNLRKLTPRARLAASLGPYMPELLCVDVGASYYPHGRWHLMLESPSTRWVAVEPNEKNLGYLKSWQYPCQVEAVCSGLSEQGGVQTLYVTNVDSGSSLLEPVISESMKRRVRNLEYFFPLECRTIETLTLAAVLSAYSSTLPAFVKLDTQGTELSILRGGQEWMSQHRVVGVELESTLQAEPIMLGSGKFWEACQYFESMGYELIDLKPIFGPSRFGKSAVRGRTFINECDAVFAMRQDVAATRPVEYRIALLAFYACYQHFEEVLAMLDDDAEVCNKLRDSGCDLVRLRGILGSMA